MIKSISVTELSSLLTSNNPPLLIDVRRAQAFAENPNIIASALVRLPEDVEIWANELNKNQAVVVYCVYGHQVSQNVAATLSEQGFQVSHLEGGIEQWKADGNPVITP